jgi:uncharacterized membrane protein
MATKKAAKKITSNKIIMKDARKALKGKWKVAIGTFAVYYIIVFSVINIESSGCFLIMLISGSLYLGLANFLLTFLTKKKPELMQIFTGFVKFDTALVIFLLRFLYVFLWTLLLVIPGIMAGLKYSQVFYILAENPDLRATEILEKSKQMMDGFKWKLFCLYLRFLGWIILAVLSLGIGFIWLIPYMSVTGARFYYEIKKIKLK